MSDDAAPQGSKLFIGGLSWDTTSESLREAFAKYGNIEFAEVLIHRDTGRSRGFGFVTYTEKADAEEAVKNMNNNDLDGRQIRVDFASERGSGGGSGGRRDFGDRRGGGAPYDRRGGFRGGRGGGRGGGFRGGRGGGGGFRGRRDYDD